MDHTKAALITGASRGIGAAAAECLAEEGYDLILTCRNSIEELEALAGRLSGTYGIRCRACQCDAGDPKAAEVLFSEIRQLDVLVNNAGRAYFGLLQDMTPGEWDEIIRTDLSACFYTSRLAIPLFLKQQEGRIINISSVWGNVGASMESAYSAAKGGVNSLTRALAKELAPSGIAVNAIACGCVDTAMNDVLSPEDKAALCEEIPAGRFAKPSEIAEVIRGLVHMPVYLTGQIITVDGGWI